MKSLLKYIVIMIFPLSASANIRVIGNGGGDLEMQALSAFSQIPSVISFCQNEEAHCGLSESERDHLSQFQSRVKEQGLPRLSFHYDGPLLRVHQEANEISVNGKMLHLLNVSKVLFQGMDQFFFRQDVEAEKLISEKLFENFDWELKSLSFGTDAIVSIQRNDQAFLLKEDMHKNLIDLSAFVKSKLKCSSGQPHWVEIAPLIRESFGFSAPVVWECSGEFSEATLFGSRERGDWHFHLLGVNSQISPRLNGTGLNFCAQNLASVHKRF